AVVQTSPILRAKKTVEEAVQSKIEPITTSRSVSESVASGPEFIQANSGYWMEVEPFTFPSAAVVQTSPVLVPRTSEKLEVAPVEVKPITTLRPAPESESKEHGYIQTSTGAWVQT